MQAVRFQTHELITIQYSLGFEQSCIIMENKFKISASEHENSDE